jgi:fatty acid desaturase
MGRCAYRLAGPEGDEMLSKEDSRRLAQLERQLRRDDPDFCARMAGSVAEHRRVPLSVILAAVIIWAGALVLAVVGWWIPAAVAGVWATVIVCALVFRWRPGKHRRLTDPGTPPPTW